MAIDNYNNHRRISLMPVLFFLFWVVLFCCTCLFKLEAAPNTNTDVNLTSRTIIKVGYDVTGVLLYKDADGGFRGYNADFLYEIAKYTGWNYEFVPYSTWSDALQALSKGEIDLLPTVLKSPEREKTMLFANRWMGMIHVALVVPRNDQLHFYGDLDSLQDLRIGVRYNTKDTADFQSWAANAGLRYKLSVYGDNKELLEALDAGKIDAASLSYVGLARKYRAIMEFAPQEMYFAVAPTRPDVKARMDYAMGQISILNPEFLSSLMLRLTATETATKPVFSIKERAFIDAGTPIRVTFLRHGAPYSYIDKEGHYRGILPELLKKLSQLSHLSFTFVQVENGAEALQALQDGRADILGRMVNNLYFAMQNNLRPTTPYAFLPMVQITRQNTQNIGKVALLGESQLEQAKDYDGLNAKKDYQLCANIDEAFNALASGTADAIYCDSVTASYFTDTHRAQDYQLSVLQPFSYDLTFGVCRTADRRLASILDKSIRCISAKEVEEIFIRTQLEEETSFTRILDRIPGTSLIIVIIVLSAAILLFAYVSLSLWRKRGVEQRMLAVREKNRQMAADLDLTHKIASAKEEFFSHISQEMQTPLQEMLHYLQQAKDAPETEAKITFLEQARSTGKRLQTGLDDLQLYTQLEYKKLQLQWEPVNSSTLLEPVLASYKALAAKRKLDFQLDTKGLISQEILVDSTYFQLIFAKILDNACTFTPAGGSISISLEFLPATKGRTALWATVKDSGIGISKEFLPLLYEPFTREKRPESTQMGGNGLGLTIVRDLLNLMGGDISIKSQYMLGTEVHLEFYFDLATSSEKTPSPDAKQSCP